MDVHPDIHLTQGDTIQNTLPESLTMDHEDEPGNAALNEDSVLDDLNLPPNVHLSLVTDSGDTEAHEDQNPPLTSDQGPSDIQMPRNSTDHAHSCAHPRSNSGRAFPPVIPKEVPPSERADVPAGGTASLTNINDSEGHTSVYLQEPPLLRARAIPSAAAPRGEGETDLDDHLIRTQTLHAGLGRVDSAGVSCVTGETGEVFDYPCKDLPSSLPPSSSPPPLFPSSPYASSQSSTKSVGSSKMAMAIQVDGHTGSQDRPQGDHEVLAVQDESRSESECPRGHDITGIGTSPEADNDCLQTDITSYSGGSLRLSRKRIAYDSDPSESCGSQQSKRPKLDSHHYLPPTPKRATLGFQGRQFKKLAAPFRPPSKLPVVTDRLARTMNSKEAELTASAPSETSHHKVDPAESTFHLVASQHKASNTSRSVSQFKSPLINKDLPPDSHTIRLTPALQALERKLQLLKRAVKVKEDKDEEVLTRLAGKWVEAGREIAYDVWDATKDASDFKGKATLTRSSFDWGNTKSENVPWGWDTKPEDAGDGSCDPDPTLDPRGAGRLALEEDDDIGYNTLGTMLRQLGIAPEIFGWDDDTEAFSD